MPRIPSHARAADRLWEGEVAELRWAGFRETWRVTDAVLARAFVCELCGNDMDLRPVEEAELGYRSYAYCTFEGCH